MWSYDRRPGQNVVELYVYYLRKKIDADRPAPHPHGARRRIHHAGAAVTRRRSLAGRLSRRAGRVRRPRPHRHGRRVHLVMRSWMLGNMDSELHRLSPARGRTPGCRGCARTMRWTRTTTPTTTPTGAPARSAVGRACLIPVDLLSPAGQGAGVWQFRHRRGHPSVRERGWAGGRCGCLNFSVTYLNEPALEIWRMCPPMAPPHTVHLKELGTFR